MPSEFLIGFRYPPLPNGRRFVVGFVSALLFSAALFTGSGCRPAGKPRTTIFDPCESPIDFWKGKARPGFLYGINYPWRIFAGDFGGIRAWRRTGVAGSLPIHRRNFRLMKKNGVRVVRWWLWPDFRGDGVRFDAGGRPAGLGLTVARDLRAALALADAYDVHLIFVIFSFDNFRHARAMGRIQVRSMSPMVREPLSRRLLIENVIRPLARAVAAAPARDRLLAWELINEPEWAMRGAGVAGDRPYHPLAKTDPVTHGEMMEFLRAMVRALRRESGVPITVGQASLAWRNAFRALGLDFYQFHAYDWMEKQWPVERGPRAYGFHAKPVLIGELPLGKLGGRSFRATLASLQARGYAGALPWSFSTLPRERLNLLKGFPPAPCR